MKFSKKTAVIGLAWFVTTCVACGNAASETTGKLSPAADSTSPSAPAPKVLESRTSGYIHDAARTRFALGAVQVERKEFGFRKIVGSEGVFATVPETGLTIGVPNGTSSVLTGPAIMDATAHSQAVRQYLVSNGLPDEQILSVQDQPRVGSAGKTGDLPGSNPLLLEAHYAYLSRHIGGIPVLDSYAWARMNTNGDVAEESVYWPQLPAGLLNDVDAFNKLLADPTSKAGLLARIQTQAQAPARAEGHLVIRHSGGYNPSVSFEAAVVYEVGTGNAKRYFSEDGKPKEVRQ